MKNVEIYTGPLCVFCDWAKTLLEKKGVPFKEIYIGDDSNKMSAGGDVFGGRPTLLWALALQGLPENDAARLLELAESACGLSDVERLAQVRKLYEQADVFETALRLVDKHQARAEKVADEIDVEELRRLLYFLVDTVLERPELPTPAVVSLGITAPLG